MARIAHDLRSPLGVVAEVIPVIRSDLQEHLTEEHKLLLKLAERGVRRLKMFVERMRIVADLEQSRLVLSRSPIDLVALVQEGVDTIFATEPRREISVSFEHASGVSMVEVDSSKVAQVIVELVSNALRHAYKNVRISVQKENDETRVVVEDDGEGFPSEQRALMFRRFVERPSRTGLGIGLSLTHDLVRAHGGRLACEKSTLPAGRPGSVGARFVVSFKAA
jgi:signal transduction histidine kinase